MYRLACLEEANVALGREQLRQHALEQVNDGDGDGDGGHHSLGQVGDDNRARL